MNFLFTPVGDTDPVRGFHDGAMLHILRHYEIDHVVVFMTKDMEEREAAFHCYSQGIQSVRPQCRISWIASHITDPHHYDSLTVMQKEFDQWFHKNPEAHWFLNVSSGTPQIKTVMAMLAIDYSSCTAVQVSSPEKKSNRDNAPCNMKEWSEMIECNEDAEPGSPNRCTEPPLRLLKKHGVRLQIESLVQQYEYRGALQLMKQNTGMFSDAAYHLLCHAVYRSDLMWKKANEQISEYKGKSLIHEPGDFSEYFQVMEMKQRKKQLTDFLVKLSPVLMSLGIKYIESLHGFDLSQCVTVNHDSCGYDRKRISRRKIENYMPDLLTYLDKQYGGRLRDGDDLKFDTLVKICEYLKGQPPWEHSEIHAKILSLFHELRLVEQSVRNPIAHTLTNMTEEKIGGLIGQNGLSDWSSSKILQKLHEAVVIVYGKDIRWSYPDLNKAVYESLQEIF